MRTKLFLFIIIGIFAFSQVKSQDYVSSLGIRGGYPYGFTFKHFVNDDDAVELLLSTLFRGVQFTGLYERHLPTKEAPGLNFFVGAGLHAGYDDYSRWNPNYEFGPIAGADLVGGLEYTFDDLPLNVSLDIMPSMNVLGYFGFRFHGGISLRYIFSY